jgi:mannose-1-phosphate guanylyltransferase / mannose-6-phosphate isomerase
MLQATVRRIEGFAAQPIGAPIIVCNDAHRFVTRRQLIESNFADAELISEPIGRNSAPALTVAALHAMEDSSAANVQQASSERADPVLLVMASDHVVRDVASFHNGVAIAAAAAARDVIVTFGIVPTEAATGFGYLRVGPTSAAHPDAFELNAFIEKPNKERARAYLSDGGYLWNSGMFVVRASVWLRAMRALAPAMLHACERALSAAQRRPSGAGAERAGHDILLDRDAFTSCVSDSIDYAVMEKLARHPELKISGAIVPLDCGWSDVGAWDSAWDVSAKDEHGNAAQTVHEDDVMFLDANDCYVRTTGPSAPLVACIGIQNTVVVQTPDALLIADKSRAQDVKDIVTRLSQRGDSRASLHRKVHRPWGWYDSLGSGPDGAGFQVKHIGVHPGQSLSLQLHHKRAEHWVVIKGHATILVGEEERVYQPGEHVFIPIGSVHRLTNKTNEPVEIVEVQLGSYLGEDDIVRLADVYGRA